MTKRVKLLIVLEYKILFRAKLPSIASSTALIHFHKKDMNTYKYRSIFNKLLLKFVVISSKHMNQGSSVS